MVSEDLEFRFINNQRLTIIGVKTEYKTDEEVFEFIFPRLQRIENVAIPFFCKVVWEGKASIFNKNESLQGVVVDIVSDVPDGLEVWLFSEKRYIIFEHEGNESSLTQYIHFLKNKRINELDLQLSYKDFSFIQFQKSIHVDSKLKFIERKNLNWEIWIPIKEFTCRT